MYEDEVAEFVEENLPEYIDVPEDIFERITAQLIAEINEYFEEEKVRAQIELGPSGADIVYGALFFCDINEHLTSPCELAEKYLVEADLAVKEEFDSPPMFASGPKSRDQLFVDTAVDLIWRDERLRYVTSQLAKIKLANELLRKYDSCSQKEIPHAESFRQRANTILKALDPHVVKSHGAYIGLGRWQADGARRLFAWRRNTSWRTRRPKQESASAMRQGARFFYLRFSLRLTYRNCTWQKSLFWRDHDVCA
jgi:hypothetical protein